MYKMVRIGAFAVMVCISGTGAWAGQSVTVDQDKCINQKKISYTATGAVAGALTGWLGAKAAGRKDDERRAALLGAVAGGGLGYLTAWNKAVDACKKEHPDWVVESDITRSANFDAIVTEFNYKSPQKNSLAVVRPLELTEFVTPGDTANIRAKFVILTPDGGEANVKIERKFFVIVLEGIKENALAYTGKESEDRVFENGEQVDEFNLPIDKGVPFGTKIRVQYTISLNGAPPASQSGIIEVK